METISKDKAAKLLHQKEVSLFTVSDAKKLFRIDKENTLYKLLQRLEKSEVIRRVSHGKYRFLFREVHDFALANFLTAPSYISLESALSFHGVLSQFPYTVTSVTPLKSKKVRYEGKEFEFVHIDKKYFSGFLKTDDFLMAGPEKALLDALYLAAKKLRVVPVEELELTRVDKKILKTLSKPYAFLPLQHLLRELKLC